MKILMVSTSYPHDLKDWKGVFIRHMAGAVGRINDVELSLWAPPGELPDGVSLATTPMESAWLAKLMNAGGISHLLRTQGLQALFAPVQLLVMLRRAYQRYADSDLYHINWLQCALPLPNDRKPALITVLGNDLKLMRLPLMRHLLRRAMRSRKVVICPNAEWMHAPLSAAFGDIAEIVPVSFGIDPRWYAISREQIVESPKRWLVVTRLTADKLGPLFSWSEELFRGTTRELHLFGPMQESIAVPTWIDYHGAAAPEELAARWFPQATGLITLSEHAEGRPQVMLEAMASSLPIVASRMPAHETIVQNGVTGLLCDSETTYADAIAALEESTLNRQFGEAARQWARQEYGTWEDCASKYARSYRRLLGSSIDG